MAAHILLVRHGPSAHLRGFGAIDRAGMERWLEAYDAAGILAHSNPPAALVREAADAAHVVSSDLPRAVASAEALAPRRRIATSPLLREAPLAIPPWPGRLPPRGWDVLITLGWSLALVRGIDGSAEDRARAAAAARWLCELTADGSAALAVTHGVFRRMLAQCLLALGWTGSGRRGGYRPWSVWSFAAPLGVPAARPHHTSLWHARPTPLLATE